MGPARPDFREIIKARRGEWLGVFVVAIALAVAYPFGGQLRRAMRGEDVAWAILSDASLVHFALWALLYPLVVIVALRFPLGRGRRHVAVHVLAAFVFSPLLMTLNYLVRSAFASAPELSIRTLLTEAIVPEYAWGLTVYLILLAIAHATESQRQRGEAVRSAERLESALTAARLECLRTQLQPHFLFNTLNMISSLIRRDPDGAERAIARLGDFLRLTLDEDAPTTVPLGREIELLEGYLEIERARFRDRLRVVLDMAPAALETEVPYLVLQPLAENAVRHGIGAHVGPCHIAIRGRVRCGAVVLDIDNSLGDASARPEPEGGLGVGLSNTRRRLEHLYGGAARLRVGATGGAGYRSRLIIPRGRAATEPRA